MAGLTATPVGILSLSNRPYLLGQLRCNRNIGTVITAVVCRINTTGEVPLEMQYDLLQLRQRFALHNEHRISKLFVLERCCIVQKLCSSCLKYRVGDRTSTSFDLVPPVSSLAPAWTNVLDSLQQRTLYAFERSVPQGLDRYLATTV